MRKKPIDQFARAKEIKQIYGFWTRAFDYHIRISDGDRTLDIYRKRWHDLKTGRRGDYKDYEQLVFKHFLT